MSETSKTDPWKSGQNTSPRISQPAGKPQSNLNPMNENPESENRVPVAGLAVDALLGVLVKVEMRSAHPPYKTWQEDGYGPFELHGETFAVTRNVGALDSPLKWRVSHVAMGIAIPRTAAETKEKARAEAIIVLGEIGPQKFHAALAKARTLIACA